jgi:carboxyl-terminal processing protease
MAYARAARVRPVLCAILLGISQAVTGAAQGPPAASLDVTERVVIASKIYSLIQLNFAHWEGVERADIDAAYREYADLAVRAHSRQEFDLATLRFVAQLRNGHTQFFDSQFDGRPLKFRLLEAENHWVVIVSQDGRLPRGSVVRSLNGIPIDDFVRERAQYVAASNDRLARTHVFSYPGLFPEQISLTLQDGSVVDVDRSIAGETQRALPPPGSDGRWLVEGRVAYVRIPSFGDPAFERTAVELVRQFAPSPNLVVDVRGNGGGTTPQQLIRALMNRRWRTWQEVTPQHIALFDAQGIPPIQASRASREQLASADAYAGRLFLLVDRFCGSACEDFVMPFKDTGRAIVIGETTQGSSGNPYRADFGGGMRFAIGAVRYRFPDGAPFEGIGIVPDQPIERRIPDITSGRDRVLERAKELAGTEIQR